MCIEWTYDMNLVTQYSQPQWSLRDMVNAILMAISDYTIIIGSIMLHEVHLQHVLVVKLVISYYKPLKADDVSISDFFQLQTVIQ